MKKVELLNKQKAGIVKEMRNLLDAATAEKRDMTKDEEGRYEVLDKQLDATNVLIAREGRLASFEAEMREPAGTFVPESRSAGGEGEWRNFGEYIHAITYDRRDPRLVSFEGRTQSMKEGSSGGFAIPAQFRPQLLTVTPGQSIVRPRAMVLEAGEPPDASITMPALDVTSAGQNVYGGVTVSWIAEGGQKPEANFKLQEVTLAPKEVAAYIVLTEKLVRNWAAASSVTENLLRGAIRGAEDTAFLTGNGVGKPLGITNSAAKINVARNTAGQILRTDIDSMWSKIWEDGGEYVWIASPTVKPYLMTIADAGSNNVWMGNYASATPPSLLGAPILWSQRNPALGTEGDLMLCNLGYYLIKDGSGPFVSASEHVYYTQNKIVVKVFWNVDGAAWLNGSIPIEGSPTNKLSPFVVLK